MQRKKSKKDLAYRKELIKKVNSWLFREDRLFIQIIFALSALAIAAIAIFATHDFLKSAQNGKLINLFLAFFTLGFLYLNSFALALAALISPENKWFCHIRKWGSRIGDYSAGEGAAVMIGGGIVFGLIALPLLVVLRLVGLRGYARLKKGK